MLLGHDEIIASCWEGHTLLTEKGTQSSEQMGRHPLYVLNRRAEAEPSARSTISSILYLFTENIFARVQRDKSASRKTVLCSSLHFTVFFFTPYERYNVPASGG